MPYWTKPSKAWKDGSETESSTILLGVVFVGWGGSLIVTIVGYMYMCIYIYQDTGNIFYIVLNIVVRLLDMKLKIPVVKFRFMQDQNQLAVIWSECFPKTNQTVVLEPPSANICVKLDPFTMYG